MPPAQALIPASEQCPDSPSPLQNQGEDGAGLGTRETALDTLIPEARLVLSTPQPHLGAQRRVGARMKPSPEACRQGPA